MRLAIETLINNNRYKFLSLKESLGTHCNETLLSVPNLFIAIQRIPEPRKTVPMLNPYIFLNQYFFPWLNIYSLRKNPWWRVQFSNHYNQNRCKFQIEPIRVPNSEAIERYTLKFETRPLTTLTNQV